MRKTVQLLWLITLLLLIGQAFYFYPDLPAMMASHFDSNGNPNDYSSKSSFYILWAFLIVFMNVWVLMPKVLFTKLPASMINVPNKQFWLANDERRQELAKIVGTVLQAIFSGVNVLMLYAFYYTVQINLGQKKDSGFEWQIIILLALIAFSVYYLIKRTKTPQ
ncbi:MAG: DUF1648 domain-containing protein [candidate division Zixibacteria bacterium]|nr:DUF1648 domain-containing protein [candidate division Zixibacteria bacterium]